MRGVLFSVVAAMLASAGCVLEEVGNLKLDKPQATKVSINYPIQFAPKK